MSNSFWNQPPKMDAKYARRLMFSAKADLRTFIMQYEKAEKFHDKRHIDLANKERKNLASSKNKLEEELEGFPIELHTEIAVLITTLLKELDKRPILKPSINPPPLPVTPAASDIVLSRDRENDLPQFNPTPSHHSVGTIDDDWESLVTAEEGEDPNAEFEAANGMICETFADDPPSSPTMEPVQDSHREESTNWTEDTILKVQRYRRR